MALRHATRYARNRLLLTVGLCLPAGADVGPAGAVLTKLGAQLRALEEESAFLSTPARKASLARTLPSVLAGLRARGECFVRIDACDAIALRLPPAGRLQDPPDVQPHDVPVRLRDLDALAAAGGWDLALVALLPFIDGRSHVRAIAELAGMDLAVVRAALRQLLFYGLVALVDAFQFSNVYAATHRLQALLHSAPLRRSLVRFVAAMADDNEVGAPRPVFDLVFRLLASFGSGACVGDIALQHCAAARGVDVRLLCVFGVLHGMLRRVHRYVLPRGLAVGSGPASAEMGASGCEALLVLPAPLLQSLDGSVHVDALCCRLAVGRAELEAALARQGVELVDR